MAYNNDNLAVAIHDTDNIITEENIEECVVDYWKQRVKDFSDVREHELNSDNTIVAHTPFRRLGKPEELLGTLQWLASDASAFVTGTVIPIDGGFDAFSI